MTGGREVGVILNGRPSDSIVAESHRDPKLEDRRAVRRRSAAHQQCARICARGRLIRVHRCVHPRRWALRLLSLHFGPPFCPPFAMSDDSASRSTGRLTFHSRRSIACSTAAASASAEAAACDSAVSAASSRLSDARSNPSARANHPAGGCRDNELVHARLKITPSIASFEFPRGTGLNMAQLQSLRGTSVKETLPTAADYLELRIVHASIEDYGAHGLRLGIRLRDGLHGWSIRSAADQH